MRVLCVDDEKLILDDTVSKCREMPQIREVEGFTRPAEALAWLEQNAVDLVLLDIDMPGMNGLEMAATIKEKWPEISICFLTGYSKYAVDAFSVRATGYLLKPVSKKRLEEEVSYALSEKKRLTGHIVVQTFGNFDLWVDGKLVGFRMAKSPRCCGKTVFTTENCRNSWTCISVPFGRPFETIILKRFLRCRKDLFVSGRSRLPVMHISFSTATVKSSTPIGEST